MSDRDLLQRAQRQAARQRIELRETRALVVELRADVIRLHVGQRLADPDDFGRHVDELDVVDAGGRVDVGKLERELDDLLRRMPWLVGPDA